MRGVNVSPPRPPRAAGCPLPFASPPPPLSQPFFSLPEKLNLPRAARTFYLKSGKALTRLDDKDLSPPGGELAQLWVSCGEPFVRPEDHPEQLRADRSKLVAEFRTARDAYKALAASLAKVRGKLATCGEGPKKDTLQEEADALQEEAEEQRPRLKALKKRIKEISEKHKSVSRPSGSATSRPASAAASDDTSEALYTRLATPNMTMHRVRARRNGEPHAKPALCMGSTWDELMVSCATNLRLRVARRLYTKDGKRIVKADFDTLKTNTEVRGEACVCVCVCEKRDGGMDGGKDGRGNGENESTRVGNKLRPEMDGVFYCRCPLTRALLFSLALRSL